MRHWRCVPALAVGAFLGASGIASAADIIPLKTLPPPLFVWTGFYGGVNASYSWGSGLTTTVTDSSLLGTPYTQSIEHHGWQASIEGGYCWQPSPTTAYVGCLQVSYAFPRELGSSVQTSIPLTNVYYKANVDPILIGPHIGFLTDANHTLWYVAGGLALGELGGNAVAVGTGGTSTSLPGSAWSAGWYIGVGAEHMLDQHWGVALEYDYIRFASNGVTAPYIGTNYATFTGLGNPAAIIGGNSYDNVVSVSINYHFH